jgi:hypothetical protein
MDTKHDLSSHELGLVRSYLDRNPHGNDEVNRWLSRLTSEVERRRAHEASGQDHSAKRHGDALAHGSGSRHGEPPRRSDRAAPDDGSGAR